MKVIECDTVEYANEVCASLSQEFGLVWSFSSKGEGEVYCTKLPRKMRKCVRFWARGYLTALIRKKY